MVRDGAGRSRGGYKCSELGYILEGESTGLLRAVQERKRRVKCDSRVWGPHSTLYCHGEGSKRNRSEVPGSGWGRTTERTMWEGPQKG